MTTSLASRQRACDIGNAAYNRPPGDPFWRPEDVTPERPLLWAFACEIERHAAVREALKAALPRLAHPAKCHRVRPSEEWAEHGSASFDNCSCEISLARVALAATGASDAEPFPMTTDPEAFDD